jgi:molecular chaperone GrpE
MTESQDQPNPAPETPGPEDRIAALEAEVAQLKDQHLRALAEAENIRRRGQREKDDAVRFAASGLARDLLASADNLRRALDSVPATQVQEGLAKTLIDGVAATERELLGAFEKHNIKRIHPLDEKFDHNLHQAMFEVEHSGKPAGTVVQVLQPGYVLHERLLRPAMVGVAKGNPEAPAPDAETVAQKEQKDPYQRIDTKA